MENWGCEFLDTGSVEPFTVVNRYPGAVWINMNILDLFLDWNYVQTINRLDQDKITDLRHDIHLNGLERPGLVILGANGLRLSDGYHRLLAVRDLRWEAFPVILQHSGGIIAAGGASYQSVIENILKGV